MKPKMRTLGAWNSAGFSLVEVLVSATIFFLVLGSATMIGLANDRAYRTGTTVAQLEEQTATAIARIASELRIAGLETIAPDPGGGLSTHTIQYLQAVGFSAGEVEWTPLRRLALDYEIGEIDDGLDNNQNGLVDEGRVVLTEDLGGPNQRQLVLTRWIPEVLEGELQNGTDDNGNGLVDERGFCLERVDETLVIHLSLQRRDAQGRLLSRTARASIRMRN